MAHSCNKCNRVNPPDAVYCYYDGVALNGHAGGGGPVSIGQKAFSSPFTLPSGKQCNNFDQLALGCQNEWKAALDVLKQGYLEKFLAGQGRADLAMAAREAARFPDKDRGLDQFIAKLPTQAVQPPQLAVEPTEISLGTLKVGEDRKVELKMENRGMRICYGSVSVENAPWLSLGTSAGGAQKLFQFSSDMTIPITVQGKKLRASNKPLEAKLVVESNAGDFIITVKAEVPVKPYPNGCSGRRQEPAADRGEGQGQREGSGRAVREGRRREVVQGQRLGLSGADAGGLRPRRRPAVLRGAGADAAAEGRGEREGHRPPRRRRRPS